MEEKTCRLVKSGETYDGKQGLSYFSGISAESTGSKAICMHLMEMPPGAKANAHFHEDHETAIYLLSGRVGTFYGPNLEHHIEVTAGDFFYIPAGVPHLPYNLSDTEPATAVIARTDPKEQESVVLRPDLTPKNL